MANVRIDRLHKEFRGPTGAVHALQELSLDVADGEFISLVGPSGCGKSTALRIIAGLETPSSGRILFDGRDITRLEPRDRNIAMVFQSYALYPHMTVRETLSNLDAKLRVHMRAELAALHQKVRTTMVYVTHDQLEALTLSDRIVVMNGGVVQQVGTPEEIYSRPANRFVAEFIGTPSMNMVEGAVRGESGRTAFTAAGFSVPLPADGPAAAAPRPEGRATLGFRPGGIRPLPPGQPGAPPATVTVSELAGAERFHFLALDGAQVIVRTPATTVLHPGETVALGLDPGSLHLFDGTGDDAAAI